MAIKGRFACEKGFLLVEHLIALIIVAALSQSALLILGMVLRYQSVPECVSSQEVGALGTRMQIDAGLSEHLNVQSGELSFMSGNSQISYILRNGRLVRLSGGQGGEIALYQVASLAFTPLPGGAAQVAIISQCQDHFTLYLTPSALPLPPLKDVSDESPLEGEPENPVPEAESPWEAGSGFDEESPLEDGLEHPVPEAESPWEAGSGFDEESPLEDGLEHPVPEAESPWEAGSSFDEEADGFDESDSVPLFEGGGDGR